MKWKTEWLLPGGDMLDFFTNARKSEVYREDKGDHFIYSVGLPGMNKRDTFIEHDDKEVLIQTTVRLEESSWVIQKKNFLDYNKASATLKDGLLEIKIPFKQKEERKVRNILIN